MGIKGIENMTESQLSKLVDDEAPAVRVWVTYDNQVWASDMTGYSREEIAEMYQFARNQKLICSIHQKGYSGTKTTAFENAWTKHQEELDKPIESSEVSDQKE